ncbi:MAG TPA: arylamine N-acetyltransferase [Gemmataceae bacterium]|nr:arylamine N-acetyltransferase [Gemmataceae bacterium]
MSQPNDALDLGAYLARVEYTGRLEPTENTLADLHLAHATHIPFENIDVLLGRPPRLDMESLQAKLVAGRRGGYCFEQNLLFSAVLAQIGFRVTRLAARVLYRATGKLPRTHMLMRVDLPQGPWLADVGFGAEGLLHPLPLVDGRETRQFAWTYRVLRHHGMWRLQSKWPEGWADLYEFTEDPQEAVDYEPANYFVATHHTSPFTRTLTTQRPTPDARWVLRNRDLITDRGNGQLSTQMVSDTDLLGTLDRVFGLRLPADTVLPNHPWGQR